MANFNGAAEVLRQGCVIPAHPLALSADRKLDERRQRALSRYYLAAGAGGLAVGVHTTQFAIHNAEVGLLEPVLSIAAEEMDRFEQQSKRPVVRVAGICGDTPQAVREASLARELGYQVGLLNLGSSGYKSATDLITHTQKVAECIDVFGFYLQEAVGGIDLPLEYWRGFCEIENVRAIKIAAFDRYKTLSVVRAVAESGRHDIALYTGNDDNILLDLLTPYRFQCNGESTVCRFVGGLLGQWAVWTSTAVVMHRTCREISEAGGAVSQALLQQANELTDANAVIFDANHNFRGCIPAIHEVLRRQGLLDGCWCLDEKEVLRRDQSEELDRVLSAYPHLTDDPFVAEHRDEWLAG